MGVRELFERMTDAWNAHDGDGFVATYAEDCEVTSPNLHGKGQQIVREFWEQYERSFPDNQIVVRRTVVEGDTLVEESCSTAPTPGRSPIRTAPTCRRPASPLKCHTSRSTRPAETSSSAVGCTGTRWQ